MRMERIYDTMRCVSDGSAQRQSNASAPTTLQMNKGLQYMSGINVLWSEIVFILGCKHTMVLKCAQFIMV